MELSRYLKFYFCENRPDRILVVATRRCAVLDLSVALLARIHDGGDLTNTEQNTFIRLGVLVESREAEREEILGSFYTINSKSRCFEVTAALTLECNLSCPYCYEDPFRGNFVMNAGISDLLVQRLSERMAEGLDVTVDFYGGEALMRMELLRGIATRLQDAANCHGVTFAFNLFSNGVLLTRRVVEELLPLGLAAVRLTIDGPPDIHNIQRPFVSGLGSFAVIMANLLDIYSIVPVDLGGNYTCHNFRRFPELLDMLIDEGIDPSQMKEVAF